MCISRSYTHIHGWERNALPILFSIIFQIVPDYEPSNMYFCYGIQGIQWIYCTIFLIIKFSPIQWMHNCVKGTFIVVIIIIIIIIKFIRKGFQSIYKELNVSHLFQFIFYSILRVISLSEQISFSPWLLYSSLFNFRSSYIVSSRQSWY